MISPLTMTKRLPPRMYASRISGTISANPRLVPTPRKSVLSTPNCNRSPSLPYRASRTMVTKTACIRIYNFNEIISKSLYKITIQRNLNIYMKKHNISIFQPVEVNVLTGNII